MSNSDKIGNLLTDGGFSVTPSRRAVIDAVAGRTQLYTANDVVTLVDQRDSTVGRATVFRTLDLLVQLGVVSRIFDSAGNHRYITCDPEHHHHLVCTSCGKVESISGCGLEESALEVAGKFGYAVQSHRLEFLGTCPDCQQAAQ